MKNAPLVLIVEDDEPIRRFLRTSLKNNGYRLLETESGKQALTLVSSHMPDLIILDLGLPDIDGVELIEDLRTWSSIPLIPATPPSPPPPERPPLCQVIPGRSWSATGRPHGHKEIHPRSSPMCVLSALPGT
ncbi:MAG: response regulator [Armatimonadota bacterium]